MKKSGEWWLVAGIVLALSACGTKSEKTSENGELSGSVSISGAFALYPLVNVWAEEFRKEHPDVRFNISGGGAGKGMADVLGGATDLGMFSREITPAELEKGAWSVSVAKDAVVPTISNQNPVLAQLKKEGLTREILAAYFLGDGKKVWKNTTSEVNVFTRSDAAGAAATWATYLGAAGQEQLKGIAVYGDPGLADAVKKDPNALGYNNLIYVYDINSGLKYEGMEVVPIDVNGNGTIDPEENFYDNLKDLATAIADGRYPSPPARELYLVSQGKPENPAVQAFISWILTDGQKFVEANGYIGLSGDVIGVQQKKLQP